MTLDVQQAVLIAKNYFNKVIDLLTESHEPIKDLRLEETELSENQQYWLVTLSYDVPVPPHRDYLKSLISTVADVQTKYDKHYKTFKIDANTGEVKSMKISEE